MKAATISFYTGKGSDIIFSRIKTYIRRKQLKNYDKLQNYRIATYIEPVYGKNQKKPMGYEIKTLNKHGYFTTERLKDYIVSGRLDIKSLADLLMDDGDFDLRFKKEYGIGYEDITTLLYAAYNDFHNVYPSADISRFGLRYKKGDMFDIIECDSDKEALFLINIGIVSPDLLNVTLATTKGIWFEYEVKNIIVPMETSIGESIEKSLSEMHMNGRDDFMEQVIPIGNIYLLTEKELNNPNDFYKKDSYNAPLYAGAEHETSYQEGILRDIIKYTPEYISRVSYLDSIMNIDKRVQFVNKRDMFNIFKLARKRKINSL